MLMADVLTTDLLIDLLIVIGVTALGLGVLCLVDWFAGQPSMPVGAVPVDEILTREANCHPAPLAGYTVEEARKDWRVSSCAKTCARKAAARRTLEYAGLLRVDSHRVRVDAYRGEVAAHRAHYARVSR